MATTHIDDVPTRRQIGANFRVKILEVNVLLLVSCCLLLSACVSRRRQQQFPKKLIKIFMLLKFHRVWEREWENKREELVRWKTTYIIVNEHLSCCIVSYLVVRSERTNKKLVIKEIGASFRITRIILIHHSFPFGQRHVCCLVYVCVSVGEWCAAFRFVRYDVIHHERLCRQDIT